MIKDCFLNTTRNHTFNSNVRVHLRSNCALDHFRIQRTSSVSKILIGLPNNAVSILGAKSCGFTASLAGNVFSTQKRFTDETTYEHTRNLFFKVIRKSLYQAIWKDDFSQTICLSRRTDRRQYDINSHQTDKCQTTSLSRRQGNKK